MIRGVKMHKIEIGKLYYKNIFDSGYLNINEGKCGCSYNVEKYIIEDGLIKFELNLEVILDELKPLGIDVNLKNLYFAFVFKDKYIGLWNYGMSIDFDEIIENNDPREWISLSVNEWIIKEIIE